MLASSLYLHILAPIHCWSVHFVLLPIFRMPSRNSQQANLIGYIFPVILALIVVLIFAQILFRGGDEGVDGEQTGVAYMYVAPAV